MTPTDLARRATKAAYRQLGYYPTSIRGTRLRCDVDHAGFWRQASRGEWEPQTFALFDAIIHRDDVVYDVGAWIGPTALYAGARCRRLVAFEPDPIAFEFLLRNVRLSRADNVLALNVALGFEDRLVSMGSRRGRLGSSNSSLLIPPQHSGPVVTAQSMDWNTWVRLDDDGPAHFIKMDIEGGEFGLLPQMMDYLALHRPVLHLSLHGPYLEDEKKRAAEEMLSSLGSIYSEVSDDHLRPLSRAVLCGPTSLRQFESYVLSEKRLV